MTSLESLDTNNSQQNREIDRKRALINRSVILILMVSVLIVFVPMIKLFFTPLLLACTFVALIFPLYVSLTKLLKGNRGISALICCFVLVMGLLTPCYFIGYLIIHQVQTLYQSLEPALKGFLNGDKSDILAHVNGIPALSWLSQFDINWQGSALDTLKTIGTALAENANKMSRSVLEIIMSLVITVFIMFYLFIDGDKILKKIRQLVPIRVNYQDMIITRFLLVSRATIKGTLVIAGIQGSLGALILLLFGIKTWLLWGVVMIGLALIPILGAWLVLVPAGIIQIASGHVWQGIVILALSFGVVSTIDNILRPRLVGQGSRMHDLLIFFSTIGGLAMFGPIGVITGPVIMAFFVSIIEIYLLELKENIGDTKITA
jgi:predicted PurR-regulated permease PerM